MRRRAKPAKAKVEAKTTVARKSPKDDGATVRDLEKRLAETLGQLQSRDRELAEARGQLTAAHGQVSESHERQTATSEILRVISSSRTDAQPVMNAVAQSAARLCDAYDVVIRLKEGIGSVSQPTTARSRSHRWQDPDRSSIVTTRRRWRHRSHVPLPSDWQQVDALA